VISLIASGVAIVVGGGGSVYFYIQYRAMSHDYLALLKKVIAIGIMVDQGMAEQGVTSEARLILWDHVEKGVEENVMHRSLDDIKHLRG
jgi:hypothetical protein